jgi:hypothetical protein
MSGRHIDESENQRLMILLAAILGVLLSTITVLTASRAVFADQTSNEQNYVDAGDVTLIDNDGGVNVLFEIDDMAPGDSETTCINVTYQGSISDPGPVLVYSGGLTDSGSLADDLNLTIEEGTGATTFDDCTGFTLDALVFDDTLGAFDASHIDYSSGVGSWDPSSTPDSSSYRITVELDANAASSSQGEAVTDLIFTWEVQS